MVICSIIEANTDKRSSSVEIFTIVREKLYRAIQRKCCSLSVSIKASFYYYHYYFYSVVSLLQWFSGALIHLL